MYYHSNGDVQTPGWNRLTQALIDNGTYITGSNTIASGIQRQAISPSTIWAAIPIRSIPTSRRSISPAPGCGTCTDAAHTLNTGVGTTMLSPPHRLYRSGRGFFQHHHPYRLPGSWPTTWAMAQHPAAAGLSSIRCRMTVLSPTAFPLPIAPRSARRGRAMISSDDFGPLTRPRPWWALSYRYVHAIGKESFNSGVIALDRRDISHAGRRPTTFSLRPSTPFRPGSMALGWENNVHSNTADAGAFAHHRYAWDDSLDLTLGGRYDAYNVRSVDLGVLSFEPAAAGSGKPAVSPIPPACPTRPVSAWCLMSPMPSPPPSRSARPARC